ncbi:MAG: GNAT family N-acetyltransferase [Anaerolineae bacterium]|jgi:ribosomal-protein-alanine N-acetyltransferase|nr:GNAT family N-acetyltransferase [Anaerolineae bacterium]
MSLYTVSDYERRHRKGVLDLLYHNYQTHTHLDWYTTENWLDQIPAPIRLAWEGETLIGVIGASEPLHQTCWIRLLAIRDGAPTRLILKILWESLNRELRAQAVYSASLLITDDWVGEHIPHIGFQADDLIVTLRRQKAAAPPAPRTQVWIRPVEIEQIPQLAAIDQAAFVAPWQLSQTDLRHAYKLAAICTAAWLEDQLVGYQLSTRHRDAAHLARLAIAPEFQGRGIGGALLSHLISFFQRQSVHTLTVNTQDTNTRSQRLYEFYGFQRNGYDLPVWRITL